MHRFAQMRAQIVSALEALQARGALPAGLNMESITVDLPREAGHGDMATNAAMVLAKPASMSPKAIAELLVAELKAESDIVSLEIAGPGFVNLTMKPEYWTRLVGEILAEGLAYGTSEQGQGQSVNVEYVSANPTGPMHVGHVRGAVFGDALARLLKKAGFSVLKEYYINDAGAQVDRLAESVFHRYREALGEAVGAVPEGLYPGEYVVPVAQALAATYGDTLKHQQPEQWLPVVRAFALRAMMELIRADLARLGIEHDVFSSEAEITAKGHGGKSRGGAGIQGPAV